VKTTGFVLAAALALGSAPASAAPAPPDDPTLVPLLLNVADLPSGWQARETPPLQPLPEDGSGPDDPCNALLHQFDTAYNAPHAIAAFSSGGLNLLVDIVFRLESSDATSALTRTFIDDMAACPTVTGIDGLTTTYTPIPFPALGDVSAAYKGTWQLGGLITFFVIIAAFDNVILLTETGAGEDTTLLESVANVAFNRAWAAQLVLPTQPAPSSSPIQTTQPSGKW